MLFSAFTHCALTSARITFCSAALSSFQFRQVVTLLGDFRTEEGDRTQLLGRATDKPLVRLPQRATVTSTPSSPSSQLGIQRTSQTRSLRAKRCFCSIDCTSRCAPRHICAHVRHSDVSGPSGHNARIARFAGDEPNVGQDESGTSFMFVAGGDDEDRMGIESSLSSD